MDNIYNKIVKDIKRCGIDNVFLPIWEEVVILQRENGTHFSIICSKN
jgi:hypothetical protein